MDAKSYDRMTNYVKTFIKLIIILLQGPKCLNQGFLFLQYFVYYEMHYRAFFDRMDAQANNISSSFC